VKTYAAVATVVGGAWEVAELDLDPPKTGEVLLRVAASGICRSDVHFINGEAGCRFPFVGGHEGAGVVEDVGPGVSSLRPGDHVVCSFLPSCGRCRYCATGRQNLCDDGATVTEGRFPDGTFRFHRDGEDYGSICMLGMFSQWSTVSVRSCIKIDPGIPLETAAVLGCGVPTGWGSAVYAADVEPGDTVVIYGSGGVGINAVQGAAFAGAENVVVVDPLPFKRESALRFGATCVFATAQEAHHVVAELTGGQLAEKAIVTVSVVDADVVRAAFEIVGKDGTVVITGMANPADDTIQLPSGLLTSYQKTVKGALFGSANPQYDVQRILSLYGAGRVKLDELITNTYKLEDVNQGIADLLSGVNLRGVIVHRHPM
jgi:alcohol dehydrogenase (nicotinoprotein)